MFCTLFTALLTSVTARDIGMRAVPGVRDSIINLGKMDVSFYMSGKSEDILHRHFKESSEVMKPCSCSRGMDDEFRFIDNIINSHSSHYKQPAFSTKCCKKDIHEDIIFTFAPKIHPKHLNSAQDIPFPLNILINSSKLKLPAVPKRNKAIEVVLFPKRKDVETNVKTTKNLKTSKKETKLIGDEEKNFKKLDLVPPVPLVQNNLMDSTDKEKYENKNKQEKVEKNKL